MIEKLTEVLKKKYSVLCSSVPRAGIPAGELLHEQIDNGIEGCKVFLAIITDNYLRSPHCLYELCLARYLLKETKETKGTKGTKGTVIPIYSNEHARENISKIANAEWRSIDLKGKPVSENDLEELMKSLEPLLNKGEQPLIEKDSLRSVLNAIAKIKVAEIPPVGMSNDEFDNLLKYCQEEGITKFKKGAVYSPDEMKKKFSQAKTVYIVSTTGAGLLKTMKEEVIPAAILNGAVVNVILPDQNSQFCIDVAKAECFQLEDIVKEQNVQRISHEFEHSIQYLNEAYLKAQKIADERHQTLTGKLNAYCSGTLLRQTLVLVESEVESQQDEPNQESSKTKSSWGWVNMTMVPLRTTDTPTIAISDADADSGLDYLISEHCKCLMAIAEEKHLKKEINGVTAVSPFSSSSPIYAQDYWEKKRDAARHFMEKRRGRFDKILIEVAAQHPLYLLTQPNEEFRVRLDFAARLYDQFISKAKSVYIYIPGSLHKFEGFPDAITLSEAGADYLFRVHGIPSSVIYGDDINLKYKGPEGVYNSADECFAASMLFKDELFSRLICVCSPYQTMRKTFFYMEFGLFPECYGIAAPDLFHDPVSEYFGSLHHTVFEDHHWQDPTSSSFVNSRKERMP